MYSVTGERRFREYGGVSVQKKSNGKVHVINADEYQVIVREGRPYVIEPTTEAIAEIVGIGHFLGKMMFLIRRE